MHVLLDQLESSLETENYYLSLFMALTIPDIASAMESEDGEATGQKYRDWFNLWIRPMSGPAAYAFCKEDFGSNNADIFLDHPEGCLTGQACWEFRCSMLHHGSAMAKNENRKYRVTPGGVTLEGIPDDRLQRVSNIFFKEPYKDTIFVSEDLHDDFVIIDLPFFVTQMVLGTRCWLEQAENDEFYQKNHKRYVGRKEFKGTMYDGMTFIG